MSRLELPSKGDRWFFNEMFSMVDAAFQWGLRPSEFFQSSEEDQALMLTYVRSKNKMQSWERAQAEKQIHRRARK